MNNNKSKQPRKRELPDPLVHTGFQIMEAEVGMLIVETIAKIRRAFFVQGKSIKAICRELKSHGRSYGRSSDRKRPSSATSERRNRFQRLARGGTNSINCC